MQAGALCAISFDHLVGGIRRQIGRTSAAMTSVAWGHCASPHLTKSLAPLERRGWTPPFGQGLPATLDASPRCASLPAHLRCCALSLAGPPARCAGTWNPAPRSGQPLRALPSLWPSPSARRCAPAAWSLSAREQRSKCPRSTRVAGAFAPHPSSDLGALRLLGADDRRLPPTFARGAQGLRLDASPRLSPVPEENPLRDFHQASHEPCSRHQYKTHGRGNVW